MMEATKVGIREFRSGLAEYIKSDTPLAITRHGQTVGYFIPTRDQGEAEVAALKQAGKVLDELLAHREIDTEAVVADFRRVRRQQAQCK